MSVRLLSFLVILCFAATSVAVWSAPQKKKKGDEEEVTQTLEVLKEPPAATVADASRLVFFVSPLSAKGLLSQQIRDGLKNLMKQTRGAQIVKIRAFVAGSGDLRRVPALVSELFTDKKQALPAVTVVQAGSLPLVGAQVVMEAVASAKKPVNEKGLAFIGSQPGEASGAAERVRSALAGLQLQPKAAKQITCYLDSLEFEGEVRKQMTAAFPETPAVFVQLRRDSAGSFAACEAIAALDRAPEPGAPKNNSTRVGPVKLAFTSAQMAFGREAQDIQLAVDRLGKTLEGVGASWQSAVMTNTYALSRSIATKVEQARLPVLNSKQPPARTILIFEGLPSLDASFATEAVAVVEN
jgi:enamine deaminase RidA (YjgF/YER057c/UK114 family)